MVAKKRNIEYTFIKYSGTNGVIVLNYLLFFTNIDSYVGWVEVFGVDLYTILTKISGRLAVVFSTKYLESKSKSGVH